MDLILDNIFLIILLLVGAISQWLKSRGESGPAQDPGYDPEELEELEEMVREAERRHSRPAAPPPLPSSSAFPVPQGAALAPAPPLRRKSGETSAAVPDTSSELARQQAIADQLKELKRTRGAREHNDSLLLPRRRGQIPASAAAASSLKARLLNRNELRQAFVLKEILEKPVGLR
jgi:hypothetical protein